MKRLICAVLLLLLPWTAWGEEPLPERVTLTEGESASFILPFDGYWDSDAPDVAEGIENSIVAYQEGSAILALISKDGDEWQVEVEVTAPEEDAVPALIQKAIDIGIREWEAADGKAFPRSDTNKPHRDNKYTVWWGYDCGWCGAFANYCLDTAGVPLEPTDTYRKLKPVGSGEPHGVREAAVPKLDTGFTNMERVTHVPRPGYLVIYGRRESKKLSAYAFVHVGLVTDVVDRGNGLYTVYTVEGNLSSRIKRFCYLYDANDTTSHNMSQVPPEEQTDPGVYQYTPQQDTWYVTEFCQTWY
ncbi:MAG: CHAP domain-containing protein [Clostridia bacterium]|nr:CHAP domain-containing protein [Clostridia bacterium]